MCVYIIIYTALLHVVYAMWVIISMSRHDVCTEWAAHHQRVPYPPTSTDLPRKQILPLKQMPLEGNIYFLSRNAQFIPHCATQNLFFAAWHTPQDEHVEV